MLQKLYDSDRYLILVTFILLCFGLVMVYSSSGIVVGEKISDQFFYLKKQLLWAGISIIFFSFFLVVDHKYLQKMAIPLIVFVGILLVGVLFFGRTINGVRRWFSFGPLNFQPAEVAKFGIVVFMADYLDRRRSKIKNFFNGFLPVIVIVSFLIVLIIIQPDLGIPVIIVLVSLLILFVAGAKISHLICLVLISVPLLYFAIISKQYRLQRLLVFMNPWEHPQSSGYQLVQSLMSIGSGGIFGRGLGQSQIKKFYLPEAHTDFIFSIIGEELGFIGVVFIIGAFVFFLYRGYKISKNANTFFGTLLAIGITVTIVVQAFINIAVCSGCIPTKGIGLPFFSYGGSSLVFTLSAVGIMANISQSKKGISELRHRHRIRL